MKKKSQSSSNSHGKQKPKISILSILTVSLFIGLIVGAGVDKSHILPVTLIAAVILFINRHKIADSDTPIRTNSNTQPHINPANPYAWPELGEFACTISAEPYQHTLQQLTQENTFDPEEDSDPIPHILEAHLIPDNSNPFDSDVVRINIHDRAVGYLSRKQARGFLRKLNEKGLSNQITICNAIITKNDEMNSKKPGYGVRLDIEIFE